MEAVGRLRGVADADGDIHIPKIDTSEPLRLECAGLPQLIAGDGDRRTVAEDGAMVVRALDRLTESLRA